MAIATAEHPGSVAPAKGTPLISMKNIHKHFGSLHALRGASIDVHAGEVVALVGDNGAGKSTLVKVMAGVHTASSGEYLFEGKPVRMTKPADATELGIQTVYQDLSL
jgi:ABC-type sugar transport system ATPase subunit